MAFYKKGLENQWFSTRGYAYEYLGTLAETLTSLTYVTYFLHERFNFQQSFLADASSSIDGYKDLVVKILVKRTLYLRKR